MRLNTSIITRNLEEKDIENLEQALKRDKIIIPTLEKILQEKFSSLDRPTTEEDFEKANWDKIRAYRDGKRAELFWIINFLKEK